MSLEVCLKPPDKQERHPFDYDDWRSHNWTVCWLDVDAKLVATFYFVAGLLFLVLLYVTLIYARRRRISLENRTYSDVDHYEDTGSFYAEDIASQNSIDDPNQVGKNNL